MAKNVEKLELLLMTNIPNHKEDVYFKDTLKIRSQERIGEQDDETELTSLSWLTELRNQNLTWPDSLHIAQVDDENNFCDTEFVVPKNNDNSKEVHAKLNKLSLAPNGTNRSKHSSESKHVSHKRPTPAERYKLFLDKIKRDLVEYEQSALNYQTNAAEKPPFNYSHIIGMAMLESGRVTLQQICTWIEAKFAFFRTRKKWNNSIRHNLSLHHCFRKIDRNKFEKGKGGYWELGVDPKKSDRKRIRNRRNSRNKTKVFIRSKSNDISTNKDETQSTLVNWKTSEQCIPCHDTTCNVFEFSPLNNEATQKSVAEVPLQRENNYISESPQYHLGTIIISTTDVDISPTELSLLSSNYDWQQAIADNQMDPQLYDNIIISSCNPNSAEISILGDEIMQNERSSSSTSRPNVIVEQVFPTTVISKTNYIGSDLNAQTNSTNVVETIVENNLHYCNSINDNFKPYIDGIEEAFQYLRSIDHNNREDILDNILDISVSDY